MSEPSFKDQVAQWPERWRDEWEERAAILEYDAGMPRARAESVAYFAVKKALEKSP